MEDGARCIGERYGMEGSQSRMGACEVRLSCRRGKRSSTVRNYVLLVMAMYIFEQGMVSKLAL